jgi:hypothetical protein
MPPISQTCTILTINKKLHTIQQLQPISLEQSMDYKVNECIDILEIDNDLLAELFDDTKEEETLVSVVDSLEKANNCADQLSIFSNACALLNTDLIHAPEDCEDCSLDDILCSLDGHECSVSSTTYLVDDLLDWVEMDIGMDLPSSLIDHQWQIEGRGCNSFYYGTGEYVEQGFCPLWE